MAAATSVLMSFSSTGSLVMLIQPSSSGAERMAITLSAMTRTGTEGSSVVGRVGVWKAPPPSNAGASAGPSSTGWAGMPGVTTGAGASGAAGASGFAKKSSAAVSMASGTTGFTMGRGAGLWSGSCPKVPPGPTMKGSMGSLPPSTTGVLSGPRSMSNEARGWGVPTCTGVKAGASCGSAGAGAGEGAGAS